MKTKVLNFILFCLLLLIFVPLAFYTLSMKDKVSALDTDIQKLQNQEAQIIGKNKELQESMSYLVSQNFQETLSKTQLNMQRSGEVAYAFSGQPDNTTESEAMKNTHEPRTAWIENVLSWGMLISTPNTVFPKK